MSAFGLNAKLTNMKRMILLPAIALGVMTASAQAIEQSSFFDNMSVGVNGGVTTPMYKSPFFKSMRPVVGVTVDKMITPTFGVGVESLFGINTSSFDGRVHSSTAFDDSYVGVYGKVDLFNLFGGYQCETRPFTIEALAGGGWGHYFVNEANGKDWNYFATKAGLNFRFNTSDHFSINIQPSVLFNMNGHSIDQTAVGYARQAANFNITAGVAYRFGDGFQCVRPYDQAEVDALNAEVNALRGALADATVLAAANEATAADLANQLQACKDRKPVVVKETKVTNNLNSVRYIFFRNGSSTITADQQPNVEMIAAYLNKRPGSKVVIKGYASKDGNYDFNVKLAQARAEAVKNALIKKYKIDPKRIVAEGQGIGEMFSEESWNRVSICTLEDGK